MATKKVVDFIPVAFRAAFGYDTEVASNETAISFVGEESLTMQSMAEDADINVLMARFGLTGRMPDNPRLPMAGDFVDVGDFRSALHAVMDATDRFNELPAKVRARFSNDPAELIDFLADDSNRKEAEALGLMKPPVPPAAPPPAPPAPPAPEKA